MYWYVSGAIALFPTWEHNALFGDRSLWKPRFGYEVSYGKVLQFEGLAQDPNTIAIVYASSIFGGLAAVVRSRFAELWIVLGLAVVQMAVILTLARSAGLAIVAVVIFLILNYAWSRDRISGKILFRFLAGGAIFIGLVTLVLAASQFVPVGERVSYALDDVSKMVKIKSAGNLTRRAEYQSEALFGTLTDVPTALFGHSAKTYPEGLQVIENLYLWLLYQYGLIWLGLAIAVGIALMWKIRKLDMSQIQNKVLAPFALWLAVVSIVTVPLYGISVWVLVALTLVASAADSIGSDSKKSVINVPVAS
jgi:hypothetical protein